MLCVVGMAVSLPQIAFPDDKDTKVAEVVATDEMTRIGPNLFGFGNRQYGGYGYGNRPITSAQILAGLIGHATGITPPHGNGYGPHHHGFNPYGNFANNFGGYGNNYNNPPPPPPPPPPPSGQPAQPAGPAKPTGPVIPAGPAGTPSNGVGFGSGTVTNGTAVATGVANANAPPGGFGVSLGIGAAIATPFGNYVIGQGHSTSVGK